MTQTNPGAPAPAAAPPKKSSGLGVAALILGILSLLTCGVLSLPALIVSIIAVVKKAGGMAIGGLITSLLGLVLIGGMFAAGGFAMFFAKDAAHMAKAMAEVQMLSRAATMYANANDNRLPGADWDAQLSQYKESLGEFDDIPWMNAEGEGYVFALNADVAGRRIDEIAKPSRTVLFFECRPGSPPVGGKELLPDQPRFKVYVVGYADGNVEPVEPGEIGKLKWTAE